MLLFSRLSSSQFFNILSSINRNLEVAIVEYGIVVAVVFVIAIGIYASLKNKKK